MSLTSSIQRCYRQRPSGPADPEQQSEAVPTNPSRRGVINGGTVAERGYRRDVNPARWEAYRSHKRWVEMRPDPMSEERQLVVDGNVVDRADDFIRDEAEASWLVFCRRDRAEARHGRGFLRAPFDDWKDDDFHIDLLRLKFWHERRSPIRTMLVLFAPGGRVRIVRITAFPETMPLVSPAVAALARSDATWRRMRPHERCACDLCATAYVKVKVKVKAESDPVTTPTMCKRRRLSVNGVRPNPNPNPNPPTATRCYALQRPPHL